VTPLPATPLWTADAAATATGGSTSGHWTAANVVIDSRRAGPGDLFVALRGETHDAHKFVAGALHAGAVAAMVDCQPADVPAGAPLLTVTDTTRGLEALGAAARDRTTARIVAVTGSVGKTGTKEMLGRALGALGPTSISHGNLNNHYGLPLSLARLPAEASFGVFELGMNHAEEIRALAAMARPHIAIITAIAPAHIGFFDSVEAIADAKAEIFEGLEPGGVAILNRDDTHFDRLAATAQAAGAAQLVTFGAHRDADIRLVSMTPDADGSTVSAAVAGVPAAYRLGQPGRHWVQNSLAVLATLHAFGEDIAVAAAALGDLPEMAGRGRRLPVRLPAGEALLIDEAYNASPAACRAAFETQAAIHRARAAAGRRIAVLGDMLELGDESTRLHLSLANSLKENGIDLVFTVGPEMRRLYDTLPSPQRGGAYDQSDEAVEPVLSCLAPGDTILVKGSLGMRMAPIVSALIQTGAEASADSVDPTCRTSPPADAVGSGSH